MSSNNILPLSRSSSAEHGDSYSSCESIALPVATTVATIGDPSFQRVVQPRPPGSLHLTPCTLDQFLELDNPAEDPYELVDGLLVSVPMADDPEHNSIILYLALLITVLPLTFHPQAIAFPNRAYLLGQEDHSRDRGHEASSSKSPPRPSEVSGSSHQKGDTCRIPDVFISEKADGSEASGHSSSPHSKEPRGTPAWKKAIMVIEVTSTNRATDFGPKLKEYEKELIQEYVIIDRQKGVSEPKPCVHVYKLSATTNKYVEKVFRGDEKVECSFYKHWNLSAYDMLNYKTLRRLYDKANKEYKKSKVEAAREKKRADEAAKKADEATKKADEATKKADEATKKADEATKKADEATKKAEKSKVDAAREKKRADEAAKKADEATKKAEKSKVDADREKNRADRLEQELNQLRGKGSANINGKRKKTEAKSTGKRRDELSRIEPLRLNLSPKKANKASKNSASGSPSPPPQSPTSPQPPAFRRRRTTKSDASTPHQPKA